MQYIKQEITNFTYTNLTEDTDPWSNSIVTAGSFIIGNTYTIETIGTTNFTLIGASSNTIGISFVATGIGSGSGTAMIAYSTGDFALYGTYVYKAVAKNTNKAPSEYENIYWVKWTVSNRFAMLDLSSNTKSILYSDEIVVEFDQNRMQTFAIGNYEASSITVEVIDYDNTTVLWSFNSGDSINEQVTDYFSYIYATYDYEIDRGIRIYTPYWSNKVRVTFHQSVNADRTACGYIVGGNGISMGRTLYGVKFGFSSFALKNTDDFGTLSIVKRAVQDSVDFETIIPNAELQEMRREIRKIYNDILVFILDDEDISTTDQIMTLGTIESASVVLENPQVTTMTFSIVEAV